MNNKTQREIDNEIQNWMNTIMEVAEETIPKNKISYYIHPPNSDFINILKNQYQQLLRTSVFKSALDLLGYRDISLANWGNVAFRDQQG